MSETGMPADGSAVEVESVEAVNGTGSVDRDSLDSDTDSGLVSRLRVIEDQPLAERAAALAQVHDELRTLLEAGDSSRSSA